MHTGYIHSIDTSGSVDGPGVRFVVFMQAVSCAAATATIRIHGYCQRDFPSPDASTRTSGASALSEVFLVHLNTPVRRKSSRKHFFARHSATGVTGAGAAASPSAAENRSFKLTFYVNFSSLTKEQHIQHHTGHRGTAIYHRRTFLFPPDHAFRAHRSCYSGSETHRSRKTSSSDWALQRIHSFLCPVFRPDS